LAASEEFIASPAFVPLTIDDGPRTTPSADIVEVAIGDILIRVGRDVGEEHLARIFRRGSRRDMIGELAGGR